MKQDIRLIAMDLDGTALNSKKELTGRTREAIVQAIKQGIHVVVATGRTFSSLAPAVLELKELSCAITSNGAVINQIPDGQILHADYLSAEAVWKITKMAETEKVDTEACTGGSAYIGQDYYDKVLAGKSGRDITYVKTTRHPVPDIYEFMRAHKDSIENINLNFNTLEEKLRWQKRLREDPEVTPTSSFLYNVEVGGKNTSKAQALLYLMEQWHLSREQVMAFGDSENDLEMLSMAGTGVAMANAEETVRRAADLTAESNDQDGVAKVIEDLLKGSV